MYRRLKTIMICVMCLTAPPISAEYVIKFSHVVKPNTPKGEAVTAFKTLVEKRLAGQVRVEVYPNSLLYNDENVLNAIRLSNESTGLMAAPSLAKFVPFSLKLQVFSLPYLFADVADVHRIVDSDLVGEMVKPLERKGIKSLEFWDNDMKVFSVRGDRALRRKRDFAGKSFRVEKSDVHDVVVKELGGEPIKLPFKDVHAALDQGVVDGQENAWSNIYSMEFHKVQDWITVSNHSYLGYLVVVNSNFWERLPEEIRDELENILRDITATNRKLAKKASNDFRKKIEHAGYAKIVNLTPKQRSEWVSATASVEKQFEHLIGKSLLNRVHEMLDDSSTQPIRNGSSN